jgi:hypothetical protein
MTMTTRLLLFLTMLVPAIALAAPGSPAPRRVAAVRHRATGTHAAPASPRAATHSAEAAARTLEDIHIEGEIPVPQVLFITARDQRRFMEFQHRRYLKTGRQLGDDSALPDRIVVTRSRPTPEKETSR